MGFEAQKTYCDMLTKLLEDLEYDIEGTTEDCETIISFVKNIKEAILAYEKVPVEDYTNIDIVNFVYNSLQTLKLNEKELIKLKEKEEVFNYLIEALLPNLDLEDTSDIETELEDSIQTFKNIEDENKRLRNVADNLREVLVEKEDKRSEALTKVTYLSNQLATKEAQLKKILDTLYEGHHIKRDTSLSSLDDLLNSYKMAYKRYRKEVFSDTARPADLMTDEEQNYILNHVQQSVLNEEDD